MSASPAAVCEVLDDTSRLRVLADIQAQRDQPEPWQAARVDAPAIARRMVCKEAMDAAVDSELLAQVLARCDDLRFGTRERWVRTLRLAEQIRNGNTCPTCYGMGGMLPNGVMYCNCPVTP